MRKTKQQIIDALRIENAQLRQLNAEWAADSARLKRELLKAKDRMAARAANTEAQPDAYLHAQ